MVKRPWRRQCEGATNCMESPLQPPPGTRFASPADSSLTFEAAGVLAGRVAFQELLDYHLPSEGRFALLIEHEGQASAAVCFAVRPGDLFIDYLTRNARFRGFPGVPAGSVALAAVEYVAEVLGKHAIRLDCVDDPSTMQWYKVQGFEREGLPRRDAEWGVLSPMVKRVERQGVAFP